ncbi:MAG TPA: ABC transporter ATP-binding protein [Casimicrobiaceae bacterium]|nr:ABC transporter ATP-binding protein [Casimicrobiaceae bacterium]
MNDAVEVSDVARRFGDVQALAGVDLRVARGEFFGLLGPNGAGKTTLISILAGLTRADRGTARILGHDVASDYRHARRLLGVVPQELVFDPFFTVRETLRIQSGYFGLRHNDAWIDELLHHLDLTRKADANMRALSGGMKRRVLVGQALVHKPPVIVLDEPTAGVDVELRQSLWAFIRKLNRDGHTIILTTHYLEEAEALCNRIAMMKAGRIVALDTTQHLLSRFSGITARVSAPRLPAEWASRVHERRAADRRREFRHLGGQRSGEAASVGGSHPREGSVFYLGLESYAELERLIASFRTAGIPIDELALAQTDLEQVFLRIMAGTETTDEAQRVAEVPES